MLKLKQKLYTECTELLEIISVTIIIQNKLNLSVLCLPSVVLEYWATYLEVCPVFACIHICTYYHHFYLT